MKKYDDDEYILMIGVSYSNTLFILHSHSFRSSFLWFPISVKYYVISIIKTTIKIFGFFSFQERERERKREKNFFIFILTFSIGGTLIQKDRHSVRRVIEKDK